MRRSTRSGRASGWRVRSSGVNRWAGASRRRSLQGSRDAFGGPEELAPFLVGLALGTRLFAIDGGDHSLVRPKSSGETLAMTMGRVAEEIAGFSR